MLLLHYPPQERALEEISERKHKDGYHCPDCESEHIVRFGKYSTSVDGEEVKKQTNGKFNVPSYRRNGRDLFPVL